MVPNHFVGKYKKSLSSNKKRWHYSLPNRGCFGFGCLPNNPEAVFRILSIKNRNPDMGLIIIASELSQIQTWASLNNAEIKKIKAEERHITWLVNKNKILLIGSQDNTLL